MYVILHSRKLILLVPSIRLYSTWKEIIVWWQFFSIWIVFESVWTLRVFDIKRYTPTKTTSTKRGYGFSSTATYIFSVKSAPNQNLLRLTTQSFFFPQVYSGWTRVIKSRVWASTPFWRDCARVYPSVCTKFGKSPLLARFYPFLARFGVLRNVSKTRLFQLVVVVPRRKDYVPCRNDQRPRPVWTWSAYVISIPQGKVPWLLHTMMRHDESRSCDPSRALFQRDVRQDLRMSKRIRNETAPRQQ